MKSYSISELSQEFDVTTRTLRFYEERGLLAPRRKGQSRIYAARDRARLKLILRGKRLGLTLDESRDIILMYDSTSTNKKQMQALIKKIREKRMQLQQQPVSYTHLRAHETREELVCRLLLEKKKNHLYLKQL